VKLKILVVAFLIAVTSCTVADQPSERALPTCEIALDRPGGGTISIDIVAGCASAGLNEDEWTLEYRLLASGLVTTNRRDRPCGSLTHVEVLLSSPALADLKAVGWMHSADRRIDCTVSDANAPESQVPVTAAK
jgi:hypothetical protein